MNWRAGSLRALPVFTNPSLFSTMPSSFTWVLGNQTRVLTLTRGKHFAGQATSLAQHTPFLMMFAFLEVIQKIMWILSHGGVTRTIVLSSWNNKSSCNESLDSHLETKTQAVQSKQSNAWTENSVRIWQKHWAWLLCLIVCEQLRAWTPCSSPHQSNPV